MAVTGKRSLIETFENTAGRLVRKGQQQHHHKYLVKHILTKVPRKECNKAHEATKVNAGTNR